MQQSTFFRSAEGTRARPTPAAPGPGPPRAAGAGPAAAGAGAPAAPLPAGGSRSAAAAAGGNGRHLAGLAAGRTAPGSLGGADQASLEMKICSSTKKKKTTKQTENPHRC